MKTLILITVLAATAIAYCGEQSEKAYLIKGPPDSYSCQKVSSGFCFLDKHNWAWKPSKDILVHFVDGDSNENKVAEYFKDPNGKNINDYVKEPNEKNISEYIEQNWPFAYVINEKLPHNKKTFLIKSYDAKGKVIDQKPIDLYKVSDKKFISDYFYAIGFIKGSGIHYDSIGNKYICIYIERGGDIKVEPKK
jgi:hypothetical protein